MFVSCATQLLNCNQALPTDAPATGDVFSVSGASITTLDDSPEATIAFGITVPTGSFLLIQCSPQVSAGRMFNGRWWQASVSSASESTLDLAPSITPEFGALVEGKKIFFKLTPVNQYGITGTSKILSGIIEAAAP
jgi:hypothetical protein